MSRRSISVSLVQVNKTGAAVPGQTWNLSFNMSYHQMQSTTTPGQTYKSQMNCLCPQGSNRPEFPCPGPRVSLTLPVAQDPVSVSAPVTLQEVWSPAPHSPALTSHGSHWVPHLWDPLVHTDSALTQAWNGGTSPDQFFSFQVFCVSKTFSEQSWSHRAGNKEQRLYLEGTRPLGGGGLILVSYDWLQAKHEASVQCRIQRALWALDKEKREKLGVRKSFCLYGQLWQDQFWNIKFISGIYIRKRVLELGDVTKKSHKNNLRL